MSMQRLIEGLEEAKQPKQGGVYQDVLDIDYMDDDDAAKKLVDEAIKALEPIVMMKVWGVKDYSKFSPRMKAVAEDWHKEFFGEVRYGMWEGLRKAAPFEFASQRSWKMMPTDFYEK